MQVCLAVRSFVEVHVRLVRIGISLHITYKTETIFNFLFYFSQTNLYQSETEQEIVTNLS
jgi:hypothetical protein